MELVIKRPVPTTLGATVVAFDSAAACGSWSCVDWPGTWVITDGETTSEKWVAEVCTVFLEIETDSTATEE